MTQTQLSKLETRIATLKAAYRIVWIEGINAAIIKGKIAGRPCHFVKAESLNENGGSWYYIVRLGQVGWMCSCEADVSCKHERALSNHYKPVATYRANGVEHEVVKVGSALVDTVVHDADAVAATAEVQAERKLEAFKAGMDAQYVSDPRETIEEKKARLYASVEAYTPGYVSGLQAQRAEREARYAEKWAAILKAGEEAEAEIARLEAEKRQTAPLNGGNAFKLMR